MKENKNNELQKDSLEQVAGGDGPENRNVDKEKEIEDILAVYGKVKELGFMRKQVREMNMWKAGGYRE